jgi:hypothetical protein
MIVECVPEGRIDTRQVARLRHAMLAALAHGCAGIIISGGELRYGGVADVARLAALLDEIQASYPWVPVWLCHIAPDFLAAIDLADIGAGWHIAPDSATARERLTVASEVTHE